MNLDPDNYWRNAQNGTPQGASELKGVVIRDKNTTVELPSIGLGTYRTSATYAALFIQLEGERHAQIEVLYSVMEELGIHPEEIIHRRKMPDCVYEEKYRNWLRIGEELRRKLGV